MTSQSLEENFEAKESLRTSVPWFCLEELRYIYSTIYDNDLEIAKQGYKHLLMWKARRSFMPPGIEATYNFSEVILQDGKFQESSDELMLPQLRLMYATTVMRFLNLVLSEKDGKTEKKTLFHMADAVGIPRWIVEIRHDSAHGSILPDIEVLRSAVRFCMDWLKRRYWEEVLKSSDLINNDDDLIVTDDEEMMNKVFDCWENSLIIKLAGLSSKKMKQSELWGRVNEIATSLKSKERRPTERITDNNEAIGVLHQKMKEMLRNKRNKFVKPILVKKMMSCESFLPSEKILSLFKAKSANTEFPEALVNTWSEIIKDIWENGFISILLKQLVPIVRDTNESDLRRKYALLWIRQILLSLIRVRECKAVCQAILVRQECPEQYSTEKLHRAVTKAVLVQRPELQSAYPFDWTSIPLPLCVLNAELIEMFLISPVPPNISFILPSLLDLLDPPLPNSMQDLLKVCVDKFGGSNNSSRRSLCDENSLPDTMFTLSDILNSNQNMNGELDIISRNGLESSFTESATLKPFCVQSIWKQSCAMFSWSRSPLGILPWQRDNVTQTWRDLEITDDWEKDESSSKLK